MEEFSNSEKIKQLSSCKLKKMLIYKMKKLPQLVAVPCMQPLKLKVLCKFSCLVVYLLVALKIL